MITVESAEKMIKFRGLHKDTKPIKKFKEFKVTNGSSFFEMDTQDVYFYNEETHSWVPDPPQP